MKKIVHKIAAQNGTIDGTIPIFIKNNTYMNVYPFTEDECPWLTIIDKNVSFETDSIFNLKYRIDTVMLDGKFSRAVVVLDEDDSRNVEIEVIKIPPFSAYIDRENFLYSDEGMLRVINNTKKNPQIEMHCGDSFIKFLEKRKTDEAVFIPFEIKVPLITRTQAEISGKPYINSKIELQIKAGAEEQTKIFNITIGANLAG